MKTVKALGSILILLLSVKASADPIKFTITPPTQYEDGSPLEGSVEYAISQNGSELLTTANTVVETDVQDKFGSTYCVQARQEKEGYPISSEWSCTTLPHRLSPPTIRVDITVSFSQ